MCRRFFRSTLQPIAEHLEYNPVSIAARYRSNYLGSISLPTQTQAASYSLSSSSEPTREGSTPDAVSGQALDPNRVPPEGSLDRQGSGNISKVRCKLRAYCLTATLRSGLPEPSYSANSSAAMSTVLRWFWCLNYRRHVLRAV